ncbi:MAG: AfsR/SARP family transcriptional regulator, partial [Longimicrobiales bacterium]
MQPRRIALLALLVSHPHHTLTREKLLAYLWPESDDESGRHRLSESLYVLRKALGEGVLISEGDQVRLDPEGVTCDLLEFRKALAEEAHEAVAALYTGPFLDGFFLKGADEFHRWLDSERQAISEEYALALETLAGTAAVSGDALQAMSWWSRLAAHDPYNSRYALGLMQALAGAGDPGNAIHHAQKHARVLEEELGAEATPELLAFAERLRRGEVPVASPDSAAPSVTPGEEPGIPREAPGIPAEPSWQRGTGEPAFPP